MDLKRLLPLYLGAAIGPMGGIGIVPLIPVLAQNWGIPFGTASLTITFYMIPFIVIQVFSGSIAQLFDVRKTLLFGFGVYAVGGFLSGLSSNLWALIGSRIIQGIGAAFLTPIIMALIGDLVPERHLGKAIGMLGVAYTVGMTLGPLFSGIIEVHYGWSCFFFFLAGISLLAGLFYLLTSESETVQKTRPPHPREILRIMKEAGKEPGVMALSFAAFSLFLAYIGIVTFTADHLRSDLGLPSDQVGTLLSVTGFSGIIVSPIAGYLGDRLGRKNVFVGGTAIALLAVGLMATLPYTYGTYFALFLLLGTGSATAWTSLNTMAVQASTPLRKPVTSLYNAIKFSGYASAPVVLLLLYAPFRLQAVQVGCMAFILLASFLATVSQRQRDRCLAPPRRKMVSGVRTKP